MVANTVWGSLLLYVWYNMHQKPISIMQGPCNISRVSVEASGFGLVVQGSGVLTQGSHVYLGFRGKPYANPKP